MFLTCPICSDLFCDPLSLPCGCNLCRVCFEFNVKDDLCPVCSKSISSYETSSTSNDLSLVSSLFQSPSFSSKQSEPLLVIAQDSIGDVVKGPTKSSLEDFRSTIKEDRLTSSSSNPPFNTPVAEAEIDPEFQDDKLDDLVNYPSDDAIEPDPTPNPFNQFRVAYCKLEGINCPVNVYEGLDLLRTAAESGVPMAQDLLGDYYFEGKHVYQSYEEAVKYYSRAEAQNNSDAAYSLGICYYFGKGVEEDREKAFNLWTKAADAGNVEALNVLGDYLVKHGRLAEAFDRYEHSANLKSSYGSLMLARFYLTGVGVDQNPDYAVSLLRTAVKSDSPVAMVILADCLLKGNGVEVNEKEAVRLLQAASERKHVVGQYMLANCLIKGVGCKVDQEGAFNLLQESADKNHYPSILYLAHCYYKGIGVATNYTSALELYQKASSRYPFALVVIGFLYEKGFGVVSNLCTAYLYYTKAQKARDVVGSLSVAYCQQLGLGTRKDIAKANALYHSIARKLPLDQMFYDTGISLMQGYMGLSCKDMAMKWIDLAASRGHAQARDLRRSCCCILL
ncbi:hypothetical protein RCL1_006791 [Eukaryota sp. TZLM3-RCL]